MNESTIEPISASADGTRNSHTLTCDFTSQSMNYAACLWRQGVLAKPDIKTPADWSLCIQARNCNRCTALDMRREEELAGKAIYFRDRNVFRKIKDAALQYLPGWAGGTSSAAPTITRAPEPKRAAPAPAKSMLDAMGSMGSYSDAITTAAKTPAATPPAAKLHIPIRPVANTGESPLQMARRLAAERTVKL